MGGRAHVAVVFSASDRTRQRVVKVGRAEGRVAERWNKSTSRLHQVEGGQGWWGGRDLTGGRAHVAVVFFASDRTRQKVVKVRGGAEARVAVVLFASDRTRQMVVKVRG